MIPGILASLGLMLSLLAGFWCKNFKFTPVTVPVGVDDPDIHMSPWFQQTTTINCESPFFFAAVPLCVFCIIFFHCATLTHCFVFLFGLDFCYYCYQLDQSMVNTMFGPKSFASIFGSHRNSMPSGKLLEHFPLLRPLSVRKENIFVCT